MGAIWGTVAFQQNRETNFTGMQSVFEEKCRLDSYKQATLGHSHMGAGVLFVRSVDREEVLPICLPEQGILLTADCLLDNREELMELLGETNLTDGQLLSRLYVKYGTDAFHRIRGLFSVAIWREAEQKLILVADQVASRCLYYYREEGDLYFSTLIEPIKQAARKLEVNWQYLEDFMMAPGLMPNLFSTDTPYLGLIKCDPGEWVEITEKEIRRHPYYEIGKGAVSEQSNHADSVDKATGRAAGSTSRRGSAEEYGKTFRSIYESCVQDAVCTEGDVAVCMSSGLDSASIGVLAAMELQKQKKSLRAYTYIPADSSTPMKQGQIILNETEDVKTICKPYPNIKNEFVNNEGKNCFDEIPEVLEAMEIPFKAFVNFPNLCEIFQKASEAGCRIVLTGQTGNASVSHGYIDDVLLDLYEKRRYITFLNYLNSYCTFLKESRRQALKGCMNYFRHTKQELQKGIQEYPNVNRYLREDFVKSYPYRDRFTAAGIPALVNLPMDEERYHSFLLNKAVYTYIGEYETKLGLRYGVVIRDATKDIRMLDFCAKLPYHFFAYRGIPRWLIRGNMCDCLPEDILNRWMRYGVQNADWLSRVRENWDPSNIGEKLAGLSEEPFADRYLQKAKLLQVVSGALQQEDRVLDQELSEMVYLYIVSLFLNEI